MKKERIFYLDFIRAIATFVIVLTHYNAVFIYNVQNPKGIIVSTHISNIYIGSFGVSLFLIISGAAMMVSYGKRDKIDLKTFYKKRFITIYPMFWEAYIAAFALFAASLIYHKNSFPTIPKINLIFSLVGLDGYLSNFGVQTFYFVGEWFLGFILIIYIIFPAILWLMKKQPIVLGLISVAGFVLTEIFLTGKDVTTALLIPTRLPEIVFGMVFVTYLKKVPWYAALVSFAVVVANQIIKPDYSIVPEDVQVLYVGICSFLVLVYISKFFDRAFFKKICSVVCKYSYPCFIVHHYLMFKIVFRFDLWRINTLESIGIFLLCCVAIAAACVALDYINEKILLLFRTLFKKEKTETA